MTAVSRVPACCRRIAQAGGLCIVALLGCIGGHSPAQAQLGFDPWSQVTLYRDAWGVPHVYAGNPAAMGFAVGWAQAEDRLATLLRAYRMAQGRAAEVWGEAYADSDAFAMRMGHAELAAMALPGLDPITQAVCEGFAAGANAWMQAHPGALPPWAQPVQPHDPLALLHYYLMSFAPLDVPGMWRPDPGTPTGNAWAVGSARSRDGAALLAVNPHASQDSPFQWYEVHLVVQDLNVLGGTLVGLPLPLVGHNARVAWGLSPNWPDFADVYEDSPPTPERAPANVIYDPSRGLVPPVEMLWAQWVAMNTRPLYVSNGPAMDSRPVVVLRSDIGPLIGEAPNGRLWTYRVGGYGDFGGLRQLWEMGRAQNLADFQAALSLHQLPCFHIVYADADGNIFYRYNAKVGMKQDIGNPATASLVEAITGGPAASSWRIPRDGRDLRFAWGPIIPPHELPTVVNPASGWVQASGGAPWDATTGLPWDSADLPRWLVQDAESHRAQRVRQLLRSWEVSFQDAQSMLFDVVVPGAVAMVPALIEAAERHPEFMLGLHPDLPAALDVLEDWNFAAEPHAPGMTLFHLWWQALADMAGTSDPVILTRLALIRSEERQRDLLTAAAKAAQTLRNQRGSIEVPWGEVHRVRRGTRTEPLAGGFAGEPLMLAGLPSIQGEGPVRYALGYGMVVELGDPVRSVSVLPFGVSDDPDSLHYDDQLDLIVQRRLKRSPFDLDAVQREANSAFGTSLFLRAPGLDGQIALRTDRPVRARLVSFVEPPAPVPPGMAPFSLYAMPLIDAVDVRVRATIELAVPEGICREEHLGSLALYAFDEQTGWQPIEAQTMDPGTRAFLGEDNAARLVAVLGPAGMRLREPDPDRVPRPEPGAPLDDTRPSEALVLAEARPRTGEPTIGELGRLEPLSDAGATTGPPGTPALRTQQTTPPPLIPAEPAAPEGTPPRLAETAEDAEEVVAGEPAPRPSEDGADIFGLLSQLQLEDPAAVSPEVGETAPQAFETAGGRIEFHTPPPARPDPRSGPVEETPTPPIDGAPEEGVMVTEGGGFLQIGARPTPPAPGEAPSGESTPKPAPAAPVATGELRPAAIGRVARGSEIVVRAPGDAAFFQVNAAESVAARAAILEGPPEPYPAGLVHFSEVVAVELDPPDAPVAMTVTVTVPRGAIAPQRVPELVLHAYIPDRGWVPVPGQQVSAPARTFSSVGTAATAYVVLGDRSLRPAGAGP